MNKPHLLACLVAIASLTAHSDAEETLRPLFNGTDFTGWKVPEQRECWTITDGILQVRSNEAKVGSTLWTEADFTDFVVELEFKFISGVVDSGVFLRCDDQIQIGISGSLKRDLTASPYIPGKGYPVEASGVADLLKAKEWNHMRIEARGLAYTVFLNGSKVITYTSETGKTSGPIGLQLHPKNEMAIDFRKIVVGELK
jgi:Domain of Unknown Function (DUF1080)